VLKFAKLSWWQAGGGHLLLSVAIGVAALAAMILVWYPRPYFEATGGRGLVLLMIGADVTLGALLTTAVFNPAKGLGKVKLDLAVIGLLQLAALAYGIHVMYSARPAYLVFAVDRFDLVMANTLPATELAKAPPPWNRVPVGRPADRGRAGSRRAEAQGRVVVPRARWRRPHAAAALLRALRRGRP
jgi:hypothetical protein